MAHAHVTSLSVGAATCTSVCTPLFHIQSLLRSTCATGSAKTFGKQQLCQTPQLQPSSRSRHSPGSRRHLTTGTNPCRIGRFVKSNPIDFNYAAGQHFIHARLGYRGMIVLPWRPRIIEYTSPTTAELDAQDRSYSEDEMMALMTDVAPPPLISLKEPLFSPETADLWMMNLLDVVSVCDLNLHPTSDVVDRQDERYYQVLCDWNDVDNHFSSAMAKQQMNSMKSWCHKRVPSDSRTDMGLIKGLDYCSHSDIIPYVPDSLNDFANPLKQALFVSARSLGKGNADPSSIVHTTPPTPSSTSPPPTPPSPSSTPPTPLTTTQTQTTSPASTQTSTETETQPPTQTAPETQTQTPSATPLSSQTPSETITPSPTPTTTTTTTTTTSPTPTPTPTPTAANTPAKKTWKNKKTVKRVTLGNEGEQVLLPRPASYSTWLHACQYGLQGSNVFISKCKETGIEICVIPLLASHVSALGSGTSAPRDLQHNVHTDSTQKCIWAYNITMHSTTDETFELKTRTWFMFDDEGRMCDALTGKGVLGQCPTLTASHNTVQYTSFVSLGSDSGWMGGHFTFERGDGTLVEVPVPTFELCRSNPNSLELSS